MKRKTKKRKKPVNVMRKENKRFPHQDVFAAKGQQGFGHSRGEMKTIGEAIDHVMNRIVSLGLTREPICYQASEAVYHLCGGKKAGLKAMRIKRGNHWFLEGPNGEIIDLTAGQFTRHTCKKLPAYSRARGCSFFPNRSSLAKKLMQQKRKTK